jgi:hypothetical protein
LIQYAILSTLAALSAVALNAWQFRRNREKVAEISAELNESLKATRDLRREVERQRHIIKAEQEVISETAKTKSEIRNHANPVDRANAATDLMSKLAGSGDGDGDGSPAS